MNPETEVKFELGWLEEEYRRLQVDIAREARKRWLAAEPWVRDRVLREERESRDGKEG